MKKKKQLSSSLFSLFVLFLLCALGLFFVFEASVAESFAQYGHQYHFFIVSYNGLQLELEHLLQDHYYLSNG